MTARDKHYAAFDKHPASRDKHLASCDRCLAISYKHLAFRDERFASSDKRKAFTLLEVLVALAVLAAGAAVLLMYQGAFRRISNHEFARSDSALAAVRYMESLVESRPVCVDTVHTRRASLTRNPPEINNNPAINNHPFISDSPAINNPPETNDNPAITITPIPATSLQWLEIRTPDYTFRRLSRCKKASR